MELFDGSEFVLEIDARTGVAVIRCCTKKDIDVGAVHEERAVEQFVCTTTKREDGVGIVEDPVAQRERMLQCDNAFGDKVDAFNAAHIRHFSIAGPFDEFQWLVEVFGDDLAGRSAADNVFAAFAKEKAQCGTFIMTTGWWAHDHVGGGMGTEAQDCDGAVITELAG